MDNIIQPRMTITTDGNKFWYLDDKRHRVDGPAIEYANGDKIWYLHGKFHRTDGPAIEWIDGDNEWYLDGKRHREDGPAVTFGNVYKRWWLNSKPLSFDEWLDQNQTLTDEDKVMFKLQYG